MVVFMEGEWVFVKCMDSANLLIIEAQTFSTAPLDMVFHIHDDEFNASAFIYRSQ